uniref:Uncharacterized protein n=1 Tax=Rhizophora mucronata TaxID=61149 RepID=A0A2P2JJN7_RHIMU
MDQSPPFYFPSKFTFKIHPFVSNIHPMKVTTDPINHSYITINRLQETMNTPKKKKTNESIEPKSNIMMSNKKLSKFNTN